MNGVDELVRELAQARRDVARLKSQARAASRPIPHELDVLARSAVYAVDGYFDEIQDTTQLLEAWTAVFRLKNTIAAARVELERAQRAGAQSKALRARAHELVADSRALSRRAEAAALLLSRVTFQVVGDPPEDLPVWESVARVTCIAGHLDVVLRQDGSEWCVDRADEQSGDGDPKVADWRPHLEAAFQAAGLAVRRSS